MLFQYNTGIHLGDVRVSELVRKVERPQLLLRDEGQSEVRAAWVAPSDASYMPFARNEKGGWGGSEESANKQGR